MLCCTSIARHPLATICRRDCDLFYTRPGNSHTGNGGLNPSFFRFLRLLCLSLPLRLSIFLAAKQVVGAHGDTLEEAGEQRSARTWAFLANVCAVSGNPHGV
ncbi:hypothetical protein ElyMa_001537000 [Elysia marginata]|uniref:Secreted protein n=1 Tax=Elysia marginata TaxID=1093978 RepID=A0AAV4J9M9_9GAST|nr:hypothetical protein ElyMa_001537000 [Elysia marginata]